MMRVLLVGPGSGTVRSPSRLKALSEAFHLLRPELPEPQVALNEGSDILVEALTDFQPSVLIAGSRGGL